MVAVSFDIGNETQLARRKPIMKESIGRFSYIC